MSEPSIPESPGSEQASSEQASSEQALCGPSAGGHDAVARRVPPRVAITYCTRCNWLLRAAWMAQELLSTFAADLGEVALVPGTGGVFTVTVAGETIWERRADNGFPDAAGLKRRVRDRLDPGRDLGHLDRSRAASSEPERG